MTEEGSPDASDFPVGHFIRGYRCWTPWRESWGYWVGVLLPGFSKLGKVRWLWQTSCTLTSPGVTLVGLPAGVRGIKPCIHAMSFNNSIVIRGADKPFFAGSFEKSALSLVYFFGRAKK